MRPIGFSTGALAYGDFRAGIHILLDKRVSVIEISALRQKELSPLVHALGSLDLSFFTYISVHAPSRLEAGSEKEVVALLLRISQRGWPVIVHPDVMQDLDLWESLGDTLFLENMDKRKSVGRTASELASFLDRFPKASLCLDLGHARQVDPTMSETTLILEEFGNRLGQLHISDVNSGSTHDPLTAGAAMAFARIAHLIPEEIPIVLESRVGSAQVAIEIEFARAALPRTNRDRRSEAATLPRQVRL